MGAVREAISLSTFTDMARKRAGYVIAHLLVLGIREDVSDMRMAAFMDSVVYLACLCSSDEVATMERYTCMKRSVLRSDQVHQVKR